MYAKGGRAVAANASWYHHHMDKRETLYDFVTILPEEYLDEALVAIRLIAARVPVYSLEDAPEEDEELSEREKAMVDGGLARRAAARGESISSSLVEVVERSA